MSSIKTTAAQPTQTMLSISEFWLGIGAKPPIQTLKSFETEPLYQALKAGKECHIAEWTIRTTPPRTVFTLEGKEVVVSSLWVSSPLGFTTFTPVNRAGVESACRFMNNRDVRALAKLNECEAEAEAEFAD